MKLLISVSNSRAHGLPALVGYDWDLDHIFWQSDPCSTLMACGICYFEGQLAVAGMSVLRLLGSEEPQVVIDDQLSFAHSVHPATGPGSKILGVVSTGNSQLRMYTPDLRLKDIWQLFPRQMPYPHDAFHFNEFCYVPEYGMLASCFDHQPKETQHWRDRAWKNTGSIVALERASQVVACGLSDPHSMQYDAERNRLWILSSRESSVVEYGLDMDDSHSLTFIRKSPVVTGLFVRGLLCEYPYLICAGSTWRAASDDPNTAEGVLLFRSEPLPSTENILDPAHALYYKDHRLLFDRPAEVYDILPWDEEIMARVCPQIEALELTR